MSVENKPRSRVSVFLLGLLLGGIGVFLYLHVKSGSMRTVDLAGRMEPLIRGLTGRDKPPLGRQELPPRMTLESPVDVNLASGKIRLQQGMSLQTVRREQNSVIIVFADTEVRIPDVAFQPKTENGTLPTARLEAAGGKDTKSNQRKRAEMPFAKFADSLVIIEGNHGRGSGFICEMNGVQRVITNAHVVSGNSRITLKKLNGEQLPVSNLRIAVDADAATFDLQKPYEAFRLCSKVGSEVTISDEVLVLGNSDGQEVATELRGIVKGVGPRKIEVDAQFVRGNSGSPVILCKTGEVIGIATEVYVPKLDAITQDSPFRDLRRFAYRLDVISAWDSVTLASFADEAELLKDFRKQTEDLLILAKDFALNQKVTINVHNKRLNRLSIPVLQYFEQTSGKTPRVANSTDPKQQLLNRLIFETRADIALKQRAIKTAYHRSELETEKEIREFVRTVLERLLTQ